MIVHDFIVIERPNGEVRAALSGGAFDGAGLLTASASMAHTSGEQLWMEIGPGGSASVVTKDVTVRIGHVTLRGDITTIPMLWEAVGTPSLFPRMDASLEVAPLGESLTEVSFYGRYDPPLGGVGEGLDRLLLHRLAEQTVRAFLTEAAERLGDNEEAQAS